jgi:pimeloyl-ACP methyl ester carboxylesterase
MMQRIVMPSLEIRPNVTMSYTDDWFGPPWRTPETIVLVHGIGECGRAWTEWVGPLSSTFRVIRPDLPGSGESPVPDDYQWDTHTLAGDIARLTSAMDIEQFHLVGAKYGGSIALDLAASEPGRVRSLTILGAPLRGSSLGGGVDFGAAPARIREVGMQQWVAETQHARLGDDISPDQFAWWTEELMGKSDPRACIGAIESMLKMDLAIHLPEITAPTLVIATAGNTVQPTALIERFQKLIRNSSLLVLPGTSYHIAAVRPYECAEHVLKFINSLPA